MTAVVLVPRPLIGVMNGLLVSVLVICTLELVLARRLVFLRLLALEHHRTVGPGT